MSPQVRLVTYPDGDGAFSAHTLQLTVELPAAYSPDDVVQEIERRLRETYPLARITVEHPGGAGAGDGGQVTWHVYRDGAVTGA
jgi:hypothetical protein